MKENARLWSINSDLMRQHRQMYTSLRNLTQVAPEPEPEPETEPELDRDTTPTPSENDWMDVSTESWLSEDSGTLPNVVSSISHKMPTVPASYNVPIAPSCCFFCGKDLRNAPRRMRIRHKSRCKRRQPAYYH